MTRFPYWCGWILVNFLTAAMAAVGCCGSATATRWAPLSAVAWAGTGGAQARVLARNASHGSRHSLASSCAGPPARLRGQATAAALLWARNAPGPRPAIERGEPKNASVSDPRIRRPQHRRRRRHYLEKIGNVGGDTLGIWFFETGYLVASNIQAASARLVD